MNTFIRLFVTTLIFAFLTACGGGGGSSSSSSDNTIPISTITLSGKASANADEVAQVATLYDRTEQMIIKMATIIPYAYAAEDTGAATNASLPNATVTLYKVFSNGTTDEQVDIGSITTDSSGQFEIPNVDLPASEGEFYYEVRITKGAMEIVSPIYPEGSGADPIATVNVSPETDLAAKILTDVVSVPGVANPPTPSSDLVEAMRNLVVADAGDLIDSGSIELPSSFDTNGQNNLVSMANGLSAAGGNTEDVFKAASFDSELKALEADGQSTDEMASGYVQRVIREACDQGNGEFMPQALSDKLGEMLNAGTTVTVTEVMSAYNTNHTGPEVSVDTVVTEVGNLLSGLEVNLAANPSQANDFTAEDQLILMVKDDLSSSNLSGTTALNAAQVGALIQTLSGQTCDFDDQFDVYGFAASLFNDASIGEPKISDVNIYHNSGFGCDGNAGDGHFVGEVDVYSAGLNVMVVNVVSSDNTALANGSGQASLQLDNATGKYAMNADSVCVKIGQEVTYTITAELSDQSTVSTQVTRRHPLVPEAQSQVFASTGNFVAAGDVATPTVSNTKRPLYQWTSPNEMLNNIVNNASNTAVKASLENDQLQVKYTYEFSHVDTTQTQISPAFGPNCGSVNAGRLYAVDSFLPTVDCDVNACATDLGVNPADVSCRMNIQTYLVDVNDKILGQAAGNFKYFCVDTNEDGDCGQ